MLETLIPGVVHRVYKFLQGRPEERRQGQNAENARKETGVLNEKARKKND